MEYFSVLIVTKMGYMINPNMIIMFGVVVFDFDK